MNSDSLASIPLSAGPQPHELIHELKPEPLAESSEPLAESPGSTPVAPQPAQPQVRIKSESGRLMLLLPPDLESSTALSWGEILQQLKQRLNSGDRFWQPQTSVHLIARDRLLDGRQLQDITEALGEFDLLLKRIYTSRRQTAIAGVTAGLSVEQHAAVNQFQSEEGQSLAEPLYIQTTLRSGIEIRHPGTVVVLGDTNPGSSIIADGDVIVWGAVRGLVQAGAGGNTRCMIMALRMEPTQIRIADFVARAPEVPPNQYHPEVAHVSAEGIRITGAIDFAKDRLPEELI
jgi:septum site-determining protein MinC